MQSKTHNPTETEDKQPKGGEYIPKKREIVKRAFPITDGLMSLYYAQLYLLQETGTVVENEPTKNWVVKQLIKPNEMSTLKFCTSLTNAEVFFLFGTKAAFFSRLAQFTIWEEAPKDKFFINEAGEISRKSRVTSHDGKELLTEELESLTLYHFIQQHNVEKNSSIKFNHFLDTVIFFILINCRDGKTDNISMSPTDKPGVYNLAPFDMEFTNTEPWDLDRFFAIIHKDNIAEALVRTLAEFSNPRPGLEEADKYYTRILAGHLKRELDVINRSDHRSALLSRMEIIHQKMEARKQDAFDLTINDTIPKLVAAGIPQTEENPDTGRITIQKIYELFLSHKLKLDKDLKIIGRFIGYMTDDRTATPAASFAPAGASAAAVEERVEMKSPLEIWQSKKFRSFTEKFTTPDEGRHCPEEDPNTQLTCLVTKNEVNAYEYLCQEFRIMARLDPSFKLESIDSLRAPGKVRLFLLNVPDDILSHVKQQQQAAQAAPAAAAAAGASAAAVRPVIGPFTSRQFVTLDHLQAPGKQH